MLDPTLVDTVINDIISRLKASAITLNGREDDWSDLFEQHRQSLRLCETEDSFVERVNGVMARSGVSHGAFMLREDPQCVPARLSAAATLRPFDTPAGSRWMFFDVRPGGPAQLAGIEPGELLLAIDGEGVRPPFPVTFGMNHAPVLTLVSQDDVTREVVLRFPTSNDHTHGQTQGTPPLAQPMPVTASRIDDETGYIRVAFFPGPSGRAFGRALEDALTTLGPCRRLLIDLRGNNGGFVGHLRLLSYLTPKRLPVGYSMTKLGQELGLTRDSVPRLRRIPNGRLGEILMFLRFHERDRRKSLRAGMRAFKPRDRSVSLWTEGLGRRPFHGRIAMLVNEDTYSAAENVAAFALEEELATLVGTRTGGQTNGGANFTIQQRYTLRLPATVWRTWRGTSYEGVGVTPNVIVEQSMIDLRAGKDTQLERAKEIVASM